LGIVPIIVSKNELSKAGMKNSGFSFFSDLTESFMAVFDYCLHIDGGTKP
jgi:hypothetical protein